MSEGYGWIRSKVCEEFVEKQKQELIEEFLEDMGFDGECYKMSIKNHEKWERRKVDDRL